MIVPEDSQKQHALHLRNLSYNKSESYVPTHIINVESVTVFTKFNVSKFLKGWVTDFKGKGMFELSFK